MSQAISPSRLELLKSMGFGKAPDCDATDAFRGPVVAYDTQMSVQGDHATDHAYIYYASGVDGSEVLDGLFYAPSLLEHPLLNYQHWNIKPILQKIAEYCYSEARDVSVGGIPMIYIEIADVSWKMNDIRFDLSDMLKLVGILDYFLQSELEKNK